MQRSAFYLLLLLAATQNGHAGDFGALMLEEMLDSMEHRAQNEQSGFVYGLTSNQLEELRQEFPTNHPSAIILPRFATIQYGSAD